MGYDDEEEGYGGEKYGDVEGEKCGDGEGEGYGEQ